LRDDKRGIADHALIQHESDRERYPEGFRRAGLD
jgi:hypothetical protein